MIKIIKKGKIPEEKEKLKKCYRCKTVFSYTNSDKEICGYSADDWFYGVECPVCKRISMAHFWDRRKK